MAIVRLVKKNNQDTVAVLQCLLALAQSGEVNELDVTYIRAGEEKRACTGCFATSRTRRIPSRIPNTLTPN